MKGSRVSHHWVTTTTIQAPVAESVKTPACNSKDGVHARQSQTMPIECRSLLGAGQPRTSQMRKSVSRGGLGFAALVFAVSVRVKTHLFRKLLGRPIFSGAGSL
jgi:hypothetical protein